MSMTSIGDLAGNYSNRLHTVRIKADLLRLSKRTVIRSSGRPCRPPRWGHGAPRSHRTRHRHCWRGVNAASGLGQFLATMQTALDAVEGTRSDLVAQLLPINGASTGRDITRASDAGASAFHDIAGRLNTTHGGMALFAGTATDRAASPMPTPCWRRYPRQQPVP